MIAICDILPESYMGINCSINYIFIIVIIAFVIGLVSGYVIFRS